MKPHAALLAALSLGGCARTVGADVAAGYGATGLGARVAARAALGFGETERWSLAVLSARAAGGIDTDGAAVGAAAGPEALVHRRRAAVVLGVGATVERRPGGVWVPGAEAHAAWLWRLRRADDPGRRVATTLVGPELRVEALDLDAGPGVRLSLGLRWVWEAVDDFVSTPSAPPPSPP